MADIISDLAAKAGISPEMARKGMGAVLSVCRSKLPPDAYAQLSKSVPDANGLADASDDAAAAQPPAAAAAAADTGILGTITGAIGKMFGGGSGAIGEGAGVTELASKLSASGFSMDQVKAFLPQVLAFLKDKLPADALQKLSGMLPTGLLDAGQTGQRADVP